MVCSLKKLLCFLHGGFKAGDLKQMQLISNQVLLMRLSCLKSGWHPLNAGEFTYMLILLISPSENSYKDKNKDIFNIEKGNAREKESPKSFKQTNNINF